MKKLLDKFYKIFFNWTFIIIFSLIKISYQIDNFKYPLSLILLDNSIVFVQNNGIHFYNNDCTEELTGSVSFNINNSDDLNKVLMAQFPNPHRYILVLANSLLYVFKDDRTNIGYIDMSGITSNPSFNLIPYKVQGNDIYIIISFLNYSNNNINIRIYKYNIISPQTEPDITNSYEITTYKEDGNINYNLLGLSCLFLSYNSKDLLTCFTIESYPHVLYTVTLDPENSFTEITDFRDYKINENMRNELSFLYAKANQNKDNAIIYVLHNYYPFWSTFNYTNKFSSIVSEDLGNHTHLSPEPYKHQIFFFSQTNEFVVISSFWSGEDNKQACNRFIMVFHDNCKMSYKGILYFPQEKTCEYHNSFTIIYNNNNYYYYVMSDAGNSNCQFNSEDGLEIIERYDPASPKISTTFIESPTTIITTILTTILTTYIENPTTIITTYITDSPTTILTTELENPTTIITTELEIPTTLITTLITTEVETPTTILTTIITTELKIPTTIITTIITTGVEIPTTILTTFITTELEIPTTIITTFIKEIETEVVENFSGEEKCKSSTSESAKYNLCIECNAEQNYFPAYFPDTTFLHGFSECYNSNTKPTNFYFDNINNQFKPCYETCLTCNEGGNKDNNNCLTCEVNYRQKPDSPGTTNCVTDCYYFYYYTIYGQYKCTNSSNCPDEANLYIEELRKCTNNCANEEKYKFQYGGKCIEKCPKDTKANEKSICIDSNVNSCSKSDTEIDLQEFLTSGGVDLNAKNYAKEFSYTTRHLSYYYNNIYSIILYKDKNCIEELAVNMPKVDFGDCYTKVQEKMQPPSNDKIVVAIVERLIGQKKSNSYSFYHPETGEKLHAEAICKDEEIIVKESVLTQLNNSDVNLDSILYLAQQSIDIFNLSDSFYKDICYHFDSPNGKDVPLQDRIKTYYPNITLCDQGCTSKGVNLTSMESICECKFNDIMSNELIEGNAFIEGTLSEISDIVSSSNLLVLKCYKNAFEKENIIKNSGGFIILTIFLLELVFTFVFIIYDMSRIRKYLYNLTEYFMIYNNNLNKNNNNNNTLLTDKKKVKAPPKKKGSKSTKIVNNINNKIKKKRQLYSAKNIYNEDNISKSLSNVKSEEMALAHRKTSVHSKKAKFPIKCKNLNINNKKESNSLTDLLKVKNSLGGLDMEEYLKPDLDDMEYDDAIKLDKREFCEFFGEKIKENQIIMNTFYFKENLRPMSIKIILLLLNIDLYFVVNGLFFSEEYLSELFNSNEEETFFSFVPRSFSRFFYCTMVGLVVGIIIDCIFIEEKKVKRIFLREKEDPMQLRYEISLTVKSIKTRYTVFIFLCIFISIISWYYISCFNNTYLGVRGEWIKSSIIIIIIMQIISILSVLLQAILRSLSFHYKSEKLFKMKQFLS